MINSESFKLVFHMAFALVFDWRTCKSLPLSQILVVANDSDRPLVLNEKYYSPNVDLLALVSSSKVVSISRILDRKVGSKSFLPAYSLTGSFSRALFCKHFKKFLNKFIFSRPGYTFSNYEFKIWTKILLKVRPGFVLSIMPSRELCKAAYALSIPCFDVQHGIIYDQHPWYNPQTRLSESADWLPTGFILWNNYALSTINKLTKSEPSRKSFVVGNLFHRCIERSALIRSLMSANVRMLDEILEPAKKKKKILITLSWGMDKLGSALISESYIDAISASSHIYHWIVRLHPSQLSGHRNFESVDFFRTYLPRLPPSACHSIYNETPLPVLARYIDLHLTELSSSVIDVSFCDVKSIVTSPYAKILDIFGPDLWNSNAYYLPDPSKDELLSKVKKVISQNKASSSSSIETKLYRSNFSNLLEEIAHATSLLPKIS